MTTTKVPALYMCKILRGFTHAYRNTRQVVSYLNQYKALGLPASTLSINAGSALVDCRRAKAALRSQCDLVERQLYNGHTRAELKKALA